MNPLDWFGADDLLRRLFPELFAPGSSGFISFVRQLINAGTPNFAEDWVEVILGQIWGLAYVVFAIVFLKILVTYALLGIRSKLNAQVVKEQGRIFINTLLATAASTPMVALLFWFASILSSELTRGIFLVMASNVLSTDEFVKTLTLDGSGGSLGLGQLGSNLGAVVVNKFAGRVLAIEIAVIQLMQYIGLFLTALTIPIAMSSSQWGKRIASGAARISVVGLFGVPVLAFGLWMISWLLQFLTKTPELGNPEPPTISWIISLSLVVLIFLPFLLLWIHNKTLGVWVKNRVETSRAFNNNSFDLAKPIGKARDGVANKLDAINELRGRDSRVQNLRELRLRKEANLLNAGADAAEAKAAQLAVTGTGVITAGAVMTGSRVMRRRASTYAKRADEAHRRSASRRTHERR